MKMKYGLATGVVFGVFMNVAVALSLLFRNYVEIGLALGLLNGAVFAISWFIATLLAGSIFDKSLDDKKIKSHPSMIFVSGITAALVIIGGTYLFAVLFPTRTPVSVSSSNFWTFFLGTIAGFLTLDTLLNWLWRRLRPRKQS